jgi:hypothetical protein
MLPHLSVYLSLVLFRCTLNNDDYFCKNSDDDVINLILLNVGFYALLYLLYDSHRVRLWYLILSVALSD